MAAHQIKKQSAWPRRGEIYLMALDPTIGHEIKKTRPALILHESDNRFLECAEAFKAHFLITGNTRHFPREWKATRIVNAREFIEYFAAQRS
jgi:predicted nucleic acid-binding protein